MMKISFMKLFLSLLLLAFQGIANAAVEYIHTDALGSVIAVSDSSATVTERYHYYPFGGGLEAGQKDKPGYTGHLYDADAGLVYMKARFYDPVMGRFYSEDPRKFQINDPMSFNRYNYANNNPYKFVDPDGRVAETAVDIVSLGLSIQAFRSEPSILNGIGLAWDGIATLVPFLPAGFGIVRHAGDVTKRGVSDFKGLEVRAQRDLSHVDNSTLQAMQKNGFAAKDAKGNKLVLHHHQQNSAGPIIEMPAKNHSIGNPRQHPYGNQKGAGLTTQQRQDFNQWRTGYWQDRATQELNRRGQ